jgi:NADH-quinone oxidoreductase subunit H
MGRDLSWYFIVGKYILLLVIIILLKNTNPRMRVDQAIRFFWGPMTLLAALAVIFALLGL